MNTQYFKYAVEVEKTGSITQAAENLFMAQPNLSKAIKELEDTLGIVIFERTPRGVSPTAAGKEFLDYAKRILIQLEKMESISIPRSERESRQTMRVSIPRGSYISTAFASFISSLDMTKGINIAFQETGSLQTLTNVTENGYDFGILRYQTMYENYFLHYFKDKSLASELIWEFSCLALMSADHPMAKLETIDIEELRQVSVEIVHGDNLVPYLPADELMPNPPGGDPTSKRIFVYERGSQFELLAKVKNSFMWVSPIPQDLLDRYNLVQRVCHMENNKFKDVLIYPKHYKFTTVDKLFLNKVYEAKNEVALAEKK